MELNHIASQLRKGQNKCRTVSNQGENKDTRTGNRQRCLYNVLELTSTYTGRRIKTDTKRRRNQSDHNINDHHDTEMDRADTHAGENRSKDRSKQYKLRRIRNPHTIKQEEYVYDEKKQVGGNIRCGYPVADHDRYIFHCKNPADNRGEADN